MTKKLLLGSTALVGAFAMAAPALADIEVTLSGHVEFGAKIGDEETNAGAANADNNRGYFFFMDSETNIKAEGAADNGINYAAKVELEVDADGKGDSANANADEAGLAFWGGFGRAELGRDDGAEDVMYVGGEDFQAGTGGIDGDTTNLDLANINDSGDAAKITYFTPRVGGFQAGVSFVPDEADDELGIDNDGTFENSIGYGLNWTTAAGGTDLTLSGIGINAENDNTGDKKRQYAVGVGAEFAGLGIGAGYIYRDKFNDGDGFNIGVKYGFGPANVSVGYSYDSVDDIDNNDANGEQDADTNVIVGSADYKLFPGVTLKGDISHNTDDIDTNDGNNNFDSTTAGVVTIQVNY